MYLYVIEVKNDIKKDIKDDDNIENEYDMFKKFCIQPDKNIGLFENELNDNDYKILYKYKIELGKEFRHGDFIFVDQHYRLIKEWLDLHFTFNFYIQLKLNDFVEYKFKRLSEYKIVRHFEIIE